MGQEFASDNSKKSIFSRLRFSNHRGFFSLLFTVFILLFIVLTYSAVQQQNTFQSKASQNNNVCDVATDEVCGSSVISSQCEAKSLGCCKKEENNCVKKNNAVINCEALPQNTCGINSFGIDLSNLCEWNTTNNKCIDKIIATVTCTELTTQAACIPPDQCKWLSNKDKCQRVCSRIGQQNNCIQRTDCEWGNNACVNKSITQPPVNPNPTITQPPTTGGSGNVTLDLKLSFQGINSKPKTNNELIVKVKLVDEENTEKINDNSIFTADDNGIWSGNVSFQDVDLSQKYYLLIKGPMHIQKKICTIDASDTDTDYYSCQLGNITLISGVNDFDFSNVKLFVGDVPSPTQNGISNSEDIKAITDALALPVDQRQSEEILNNLDFNLDGIVSTQDLSLILSALKTKSDER